MPSGFLAYGCPVAGGGGIATLQASSGNGSVPTESAAEHGTGWPYKVIAAWDTHQYVFIEPGTTTICVGASTGDSAGIASVTFYLNGNTVTVTTQTLNPDNSTYGFCISPSTGGGGTDGDYTLYAKVIPVNGFERLLALPITLNSNGTITRPLRYVDFSKPNNSGDGLSSATAWKTISFATGAVSALPGGAAEIVCAAGTYLEDASGSGNSGNTRLVKVRPASGASVIVSRTTKGTPSRDLTLGCSKFQMVGLTLAMDKFAAVTGVGTPYVVCTGCTLTDANGVLGPLYSYNSGNSTEIFDNPGWHALEECMITCPIAVAFLERNNTSRISWEAWMVGNSAQTINTTGLSRWNIDQRQPNQFTVRCSSTDTITVTGSSFSTNTTVNFAAGAITVVTPEGRIGWVSGSISAKTVTGIADNGSGRTRLTLNNTTGLQTGDSIGIRGVVGTEDIPGGNPLNEFWYSITVIDGTHIDLPASSRFTAASGAYASNSWASGGVVMKIYDVNNSSTGASTITLNGADYTANFQIGDVLWFSSPAHSDSDQYFTAGNNPAPYYENIYWQRVKCVGVSLQHVLCQPGAGAGGGTISGGAASDGGVITFTAAQAFGVNGWVIPTSGAHSGKAFRIVSVGDSTHATLDSSYLPSSSITAGTTWNYTLAIANHAQVECLLEGHSTTGQMQGGATHWVVDGCSFLGSALNFRNDGASNVTSSTEAQAALVYKNSIFQNMGVQGGSFPTRGITIDNCQFLTTSTAAAAVATNSVTTTATFNTTIGSNYGRPTSGVSKTMTPPVPYDASGRAIAAGTNIGALAI